MVELDAKRLFQLCDPTLEPTVFLIGVLTAERDNRHPICIEPEENKLVGGSTLEPSSLSGLQESAESVLKTNPHSSMLYSNPIAGQRAREALRGYSLSEALRQRLDAITYRSDAIHFCGTPVPVEGFAVVPVLRLKRSSFEGHYALRRSERDGVSVVTSLLQAAIKVFLEDVCGHLERPEPGSRLGEARRPAEELMRAAGQLIAMTAGYAAGGVVGIHGLFELCNAISEMRYESGESRGGLVICRRDHPDVDLDVVFRSPIPVREHRTVRKLVEVTKGARRLITDGTALFGAGLQKGRYDGVAEDLFEIRFVGHHRWELLHAGHLMMKVGSGLPELPRPSRIEPVFHDVFRRIFANRDPSDSSRIWRLIEAAIALHRGCTLAIVEAAVEEAVRLGGQAVVIEPIAMEPELLDVASAIDGAVLLDVNGRCHAFGVILDGHATAKGDRSRGSRYNSAVRYQHSIRSACVIVVISEDGMIDVLPKLRPRISRARLVAILAQLDAATQEKLPNRATYYEAIQWLKEHAFYLTKQQCDQANVAKRRFEESAVTKGLIRVYDDLRPDPELSDEYFVP